MFDHDTRPPDLLPLAILDVRPDMALARDEGPYVRVLEAADRAGPGERIIVIAPAEPWPLYKVLDARGFSHASEHVGLDEWVVEFTRWDEEERQFA